jgi:probable inactive protein kinase-like protein SgK071
LSVSVFVGLQVVKKLGKGAQGSVFLAQNKEDNQLYVLKKVECNDESEANKAFKEV